MTPERDLPKHSRYQASYERFGFFWGLGVEHETYLMTSRTRKVTTFNGIQRRERYSVDYFRAYNADALADALKDVIDACGSLVIPILMNGHSMIHCDISGEHRTTYEKVPQPNPKYSGTTCFEWICSHSAWMCDEINRTFMWDGDTVEFMTQRFYRATVAGVMDELIQGEARFAEELAALPKEGVFATHGPMSIASPHNQEWATYLTNPRHVSMFNNGTIHINVTLPTRLGWNRRPLWPTEFREKHRRLARLVQWFEPLWIAVHGAGDPFAFWSPTYGHRFAAGSQRLAVSRYIGVGTFDTDTMPVGKILQIPKAEAGPLPWYDWLHARTAYTPLDDIGLDINYSKHGAHGLELRFLDQLPMESLRSVMEQVVVLMDITLEGGAIPNPRTNPRWITMAGSALYHGPRWIVEPEEINAICRILRIPAGQKEPMGVADALQWLFGQLETRHGFCWRKMVRPSAADADAEVGCFCCRRRQ